MMNLKALLTQPLRQLPNSLVIGLLIVALLGFVDATYLTIEHYRDVIPPCSLVAGCEVVLSSDYSVVAGVPVSLGGAIYYLLVLIGIFAYLEGKREKFLRGSLMLTVAGFAATLWFLYIQAFVLHSFCLYCLGSAVSSTLLFAGALYVFWKYHHE